MAVFGAIGHGGRGKTLSTVHRLWKLYKQGQAVWSNTPLVDLRISWDDKKRRYIPLDRKTFGKSWAERYVYDVDQVLEARDCELLLDEVGAWLPADEWKEIPRSFRRLITQDRRNGLNIWWTYRHTRVWNEIRDNTLEFRYTYKYMRCFIVQRCVDAENPKAKPVYDFFTVEPSTFQLYQTFAEVGDRTGQGYGFGALASRRGYYILSGWTDHNLTISVTEAQFQVLADVYGYDMVAGAVPGSTPEGLFLGMVREVDALGNVSYRSAVPSVPAPL